MFVDGKSFGLRLCKVLAIEPEGVCSLTINVPCDGMATVLIERLVTRDNAGNIETLFNQFEGVRYLLSEKRTEPK